MSTLREPSQSSSSFQEIIKAENAKKKEKVLTISKNSKQQSIE